MPFITAVERIMLDDGADPTSCGQECYCYYKAMVDMWRKNRRWTEADKIYRWVKETDDASCDLAWQVFFNLHVMEYEAEKRWQNGDI